MSAERFPTDLHFKDPFAEPNGGVGPPAYHDAVFDDRAFRFGIESSQICTVSELWHLCLAILDGFYAT